MPIPDPNLFEKLGAFYLGREYDVESRSRRDDLLLYDSKDLVTHAVCVGMTGSGKTGLCIGVLEEAAIDGVPAIVIDPKGDLSNLLLTFPELRPSDFAPWVNAEDAARKGMTAEAFAAAQAELWKKGLGEWGEDGERIRRLKDAAEFTIYTPGSTAGRPLAVLRGFDAPSEAIRNDAELFREHVVGTTTSLLSILGLDTDAQSRENIFLAAIFSQTWSQGKSLDLASLIAAIQSPGFTKLGLMELETVYPSKDRFALAMAINNLAASPGFSTWLEGEPLDIASLLRTSSGKPRIAILSIAHLNDAQRMFFVSILLNQVLSWVRTQSGTSSLRTLLYMDEIAGYFPPVANPPSKQPLLTLMKQGRAFGLGVMLATQNPVDLDYKGLSNAGTWFIGRLQTDRDKQRVLDGLEGASSQAGARFDRAAMDRLISSLGPRIFLMNNVHEDAPVVFETRWCMSYLRGPLTRDQIRTLASQATSPIPASAATPPTSPPASATSTPPRRAAVINEPATNTSRPVLPPDVSQYFLPLTSAFRADLARDGGSLRYRPALLGLAKIYYQDAKTQIDAAITAAQIVEISGGPLGVDWEHAETVSVSENDLQPEPASAATFEPLPSEAQKGKSYDTWKKSYADHLARSHTLDLFGAPSLKLWSQPEESERDFRARAAHAVREHRDAAIEKLRMLFAPKVASIEERIRRAEQQVEVQRQQARDAKLSTAASFGSAVLGALLGRKTLSAGNVSKAATAFRGVSKSSKEASDVGRAEENVEALNTARRNLAEEFQAQTDEIAQRFDVTTMEFERLTLKPKKTGISVRAVCLVWEPVLSTE